MAPALPSPSRAFTLLDRGLWIFFLIWLSVGIGCALFGVRMPVWMRWADPLSLVLAAAVTYTFLLQQVGLAKTRLCFVLIAVASLLVEWIAVNTGHPFGHYTYTDRLGLRLLHFQGGWQGVPLVIPLAWFTLCICSFHTARLLLRGKGFYPAVVVAGILTLLTDINLEPVAWYMRGAQEAYWRWIVDDPFAGVPLQNYLSWFTFTVLFLLICPLRREDPGQIRSWRPVIILAMLNLLFLAVRIHYALR